MPVAAAIGRGEELPAASPGIERFDTQKAGENIVASTIEEIALRLMFARRAARIRPNRMHCASRSMATTARGLETMNANIRRMPASIEAGICIFRGSVGGRPPTFYSLSVKVAITPPGTSGSSSILKPASSKSLVA